MAHSVNGPSVSPVGFPHRSRTAVAVAEMGFHAAIAPSQPGIVYADTTAVDKNPTGQTRS